MSGVASLATSLQAAVAVAVATTFDDIIYLTGFFADRDRNFHTAHVVVGECLGFSALIATSLVASQILRHSAASQETGWLGVVPILVGLFSLVALIRSPQSRGPTGRSGLNPDATLPRPIPGTAGAARQGLLQAFGDRRSYVVAAIAISNGANNLAVYIPLLGNSSLGASLLTIAVCYSAVLTWIFVSFRLTRLPGLAELLSRHANQVFPFVLMGISKNRNKG
ncbi:MAG: cadmium resistance transporter [Cyanobacteriota bacterium]